jgi:hypothetical protein
VVHLTPPPYPEYPRLEMTLVTNATQACAGQADNSCISLLKVQVDYDIIHRAGSFNHLPALARRIQLQPRSTTHSLDLQRLHSIALGT